LLALLLAGQLLHAGSALSGGCKGEAVTTGDSREEVAAKCGEAMLKEQRKLTVEETDKEGKIVRTVTDIEEWTFDSGPEELMQSYRFENGKLADIRSIGYGRIQDPMVDNCRNGTLLAEGDSTIEAFLKCGEPLAKQKLEDKVVESTEGDKKRRTSLPVAEWTYRYGRDLPGYTLTFEDGKVTKIRTREFGK